MPVSPNKICLIIRREYEYRVKKKSFWLITLLTPCLFAALILVPLRLSTIRTDEVRTVAIIDTTGRYAPLFQDTGSYRFIRIDRPLDEYRQEKPADLFAILHITGDLLQTPDRAVLYSERQLPSDLQQAINGVLSRYLEQEKIASFQIPDLDRIIRESRINFRVATVKWGNDGSAKTSSAGLASSIGLMLTTLVFFFIMTYGSMVLQGVTEEKSNRIMEVMVSSVRPFELMIGKIIGIGLVGITQLLLWGVLTAVLIGGSRAFLFGSDPLAGGATNGFLQALQALNLTEIGFAFLLYFIGGYLLYGALYSAIGSAVDSPEDTQQLIMPVLVLMLFAFYTGIYSMNNPDGPLAFWCSLIPFTSPVVMMIRLPFDVPAWQLALSLFLLYGGALGIVWISSKVYRVGILMYGKKPSFREIAKWIKYK